MKSFTCSFRLRLNSKSLPPTVGGKQLNLAKFPDGDRKYLIRLLNSSALQLIRPGFGGWQHDYRKWEHAERQHKYQWHSGLLRCSIVSVISLLPTPLLRGRKLRIQSE